MGLENKFLQKLKLKKNKKFGPSGGQLGRDDSGRGHRDLVALAGRKLSAAKSDRWQLEPTVVVFVFFLIKKLS